MVRYEIEIVEARNIPVADIGGTSDPYIEVCTAAGGRMKTDTKKKTLNPVWREKKLVDVANPALDAVGFLMYDWDRMSANDIIAYTFITLARVPPNGMPMDIWIDLYKKSKKANKANAKAANAQAKVGHPPKPAVPGGQLHLIVRLMDVAPMAAPMPMPGQPMMMPGQPMPGQPMPGQPMPGQPMMMPGQPMPGQPMPGQPMPGQPMPGQPMMMPGQPMPGQPMMMPGQPMMMPGPVIIPPGAPNPLAVPNPYNGAVPVGFQNKSGFLRPKKTDAEVAGHIAGKGAKKTLKALGKILF